MLLELDDELELDPLSLLLVDELEPPESLPEPFFAAAAPFPDPSLPSPSLLAESPPGTVLPEPDRLSVR